MNQTREPEDRTQRSVAELLARYGEPSTGGRRHRAPEAEDTAPQSIIDRVRSDREVPQHEGRAARRKPAEDEHSPFDPARPGSYRSSLATGPAAWWDQHGAAEGHRDDEYRDDEYRLHLPMVGGDDPFAGPDEPSGPSTEQLSRVDPAPRPMMPVRAPDRPRAGTPPAGLASPPGPDAIEEADHDDHDDHDDYEGYEGYEDDDEPTGSPAREWAMVASQVGAGVVGGAVLWLVCEWLWQNIPVVALVVALAVITGLVWVVRWVRRAEDLQTTVIAVLVGLFVTVSPATLLLVDR